MLERVKYGPDDWSVCVQDTALVVAGAGVGPQRPEEKAGSLGGMFLA